MNRSQIDLYRLKPAAIWKAFATDNFAFWMSCAYLFFEYVRPQAIWSIFEVYPYWARTFIMLAFFGWLIDSDRRFVWTKFTTGVFLFLILIILSSMFAYWPEISSEHFMDYFNWVVVFFVLTQTITTRNRFYIFLIIFMGASFKLSFHGARTFAMRGFAFADWGLAGPRGYFQNPGELAVQMLMFAPISLYFILAIKKFLKRWQVVLLYLMPVTAALTIIGTNTRGSQLALLVQGIIFILLTKHRFKMLLLVGIICFVGYSILPDEQKMRFSSAGEDQTSVQRLLYWKHGWQMIKDHPLLGVGYYNFPPYYNRFHSDDIVLDIIREAQLPHNIFIQVGTDTGFSGLTVFISLICIALSVTVKIGLSASNNEEDLFFEYISKGLNIALIGFLIAGQFVTITYYPFFWIHLVFVSSLSICYWNESAETRNHRSI